MNDATLSGEISLQRQDAAVSGVEESLFVTGDTTTIAGTTLAAFSSTCDALRREQKSDPATTARSPSS